MTKKTIAITVASILSATVTSEVSAKTYQVEKGDSLWKIAKKFHTTIPKLKEWNELSNDSIIPNQVLTVSEPVTSKSNVKKTYTVQAGDTLIAIANKHNISLAELKLWNNLNSDLIYPGDTLVISPEDEKMTTSKQTKPSNIYTVKKGDSLWKIAYQHGTTVAYLKQLNHLHSNLIFPNQQIQLTANKKYIVKAGDTLSSIAKAYGVTVKDLKKWNKLSTDLIQIGQKLTIKNIAPNYKSEKKTIKELKTEAKNRKHSPAKTNTNISQPKQQTKPTKNRNKIKSHHPNVTESNPTNEQKNEGKIQKTTKIDKTDLKNKPKEEKTHKQVNTDVKKEQKQQNKKKQEMKNNKKEPVQQIEKKQEMKSNKKEPEQQKNINEKENVPQQKKSNKSPSNDIEKDRKSTNHSTSVKQQNQPITKSKAPKEMTMTATAYTAACDGCSGITYTGINLNENRHAKVIAVDPSVIPLGSKVEVEGYGQAIAGDIGSAIQGNKIDIHVPTKEEAYNWGVRTVKVKILD